MEQKAISVLIIEDESMWADTISDSLSVFGFSIAGVAKDFDEAVIAIEKTSFDVAIIDIFMDGRSSGIELGKLLTESYKKPVIFLTASSSRNIATDALDARPSAYLVKPFDPVSLFMSIQSALQNFRDKVTDDADHPLLNTDSFFVKVGDKYKKIRWDEIVYMSSDKNYTSLFNSADKTSYYIRSTLLKTLQHVIPTPARRNFAQVNRAEAVNIRFIKEIMGDDVITPYTSLSLTNSYARELKDKINLIM